MSSIDLGKRKNYLQGLDGIRAFAVLVVLVGHCFPFFAFFLGVDIFFVLSGFLITRLLLQEHEEMGRISLKFFYIRRVYRILPPLIILLLLDGALRPFYETPKVLSWWKSSAVVLLECANFFRLELGALGHTWSLSVEEQFYTVWPVCLIFLLRSSKGGFSLLRIPSLVIVAAMLLRSVLRLLLLGIDLYAFTPARIDSLLVGSVVAMIPLSLWTKRMISRLGELRAPELIAAFILVLVWISREGRLYHMGFTLFAGLVAIFILCVAQETKPTRLVKILESPAACWIGKRSYGIYLYHLPIVYAMEATGMGLVPRAFFVISLTFLMAAASYRFVETPLLRRKDGFRSQVPAQPMAQTVGA